MKTLNEVIKANECCNNDNRCEDCPYNGIGACALERQTDALHYLKRYKADLSKKCSNCKCWHGHESYDPEDPWREEYFCGYETWTYPDDSCSKWEEME